MDPGYQFPPTPEQETFFSLIENWRKEKNVPLQQIIEGSERDLFVYSLLKNWEDIALLLSPSSKDFILQNTTMILRLIAKNNMFSLFKDLHLPNPRHHILSSEVVNQLVYSSPLEIALYYGSIDIISLFLSYLYPEDIINILDKGSNRKPSTFETLVRMNQTSVIRSLIIQTNVQPLLIPYQPILVNFIDILFRSSLVYESEEVLTEVSRWYNLNLLAKNYNLIRYIIVTKKERILHHLLELIPNKKEFLINKVLNKICKMGYLSMLEDVLSFLDDKVDIFLTLGFIPLKKAVFAGRTELALYLLNLIKTSGYQPIESLVDILIFEAEIGNREETMEALFNFGNSFEDDRS